LSYRREGGHIRIGRVAWGRGMGTVINFPAARRPERAIKLVASRKTARVVILPVIRIERPLEAAPDERPKPRATGAARKRRRRARRS